MTAKTPLLAAAFPSATAIASPGQSDIGDVTLTLRRAGPGLELSWPATIQNPYGSVVRPVFELLPRLLSRRAALWAVVGLLAALAFVAPSARAAVTEAWVQRSDCPRKGDERAQAVAVDGNGNVVVTGDSNISQDGWHYDHGGDY